MSDILDTLRQEGVDPALLAAVDAAHRQVTEAVAAYAKA